MPRYLSQQCAGFLGALFVASTAWAQTGNTGASSDSKRVPLATLLQSHGYIPLPVTHLGGCYTLGIKVDSTSLTFLFDSGYNGSLSILRQHADALGIHGAPARVSIGAGGAAAKDTTHVDRFTLGTLRLGSQYVSIDNALPVADGSVGAPVAMAYNAILDYTHDVMYVQSPSQQGFALLPGTVEGQGDVAIPLTRVVVRKDSGSPGVIYLVRAIIDSTPVTLLLDTGANQDLILDQHRAAQLGAEAESSGQVTGIGGQADVGGGTLNHFSIGTIRLDDFDFMTMDLSKINERYQSDGYPPIDGVLGAVFLTGKNAMIDFGHDMLYLQHEQ